MEKLLIVTLFTALPDTLESQYPGTCSNVSKGEPLECCPNYRIVGTSCVECWPGSRGVDCVKNCTHGFYGRLCREMCECYPCDKVKGCQNITQKDEGPTRIDWFTILNVLLGGFVVCCILCLSVFCIFRLSASAAPNVLTEKGAQKYKDFNQKLQHNLSQKASSVDVARSKDIDSDAQCKGVCQTKDPLYITETDEPKAVQYYQIDPIEEPYNILKLSYKNDVQKIKTDTNPLQKLSLTKHGDTLERKRCREAVGML